MQVARRRARNSARKQIRKLRFRKKIYDNVHGYIDITETEKKLIDTPIFQRLRRIAHLGLADYVYPGATHSRFSHSLGSMFVMHKIVSQINEDNNMEIIDNNDLVVLRLAALLHDIGHYPFSHVLEVVMKGIYEKQADKEKAKHERLGEHILLQTYLYKIVKKVCDPENIAAILRGEFREPLLYQYLTSSSLDVDKIDYLQRDSLHTGVAYGAFDADRLLRCLMLDRTKNPNRLVVTRGGRQAIEDFLLARYQMFQSVYYHKTVVAFELMLQTITETLIRNRELPDLDSIKQSIEQDANWFATYDDPFVWTVLRNKKDENSVTGELVRMLLSHKSLKVADEDLTLSDAGVPIIMKMLAKDKLSEWLSERSGVDKDWIFYKQQPEVTFLETDPELTVYIETPSGPKSITEVQNSIIKKLWDSQFRAYRVYTRNRVARTKIEDALRLVR